MVSGGIISSSGCIMLRYSSLGKVCSSKAGQDMVPVCPVSPVSPVSPRKPQVVAFVNRLGIYSLS